MLALVVAVALSASPRSDAHKSYEAARASYYRLKANSAGQKLRHNWLRAIASFTAVAEDYPKSEEAARALYTAAELWNDLSAISRLSSDADQALSNYERVASEHPSSSLADDALFASALMYHARRHDEDKSARAVKQILDAHPTGDMAPKARELLARLTQAGVKPAATEETTAKVVGRRENESGKSKLLEVKRWSNPTYSRIAVTLGGAAQARSGWLPAEKPGAPRALIVDISPAQLPEGGLQLPSAEDTLVTKVTAEPRNDTTVRLTLTLSRAAKQRIMVLENPYRVVIDVNDDEPTSGAKPAAVAAPAVKRGKSVVVIDPGHGGKDVGATGPGGAREKDVALAIAKQTAEQLRAAGIDVVLTRNDDTFISLEERTAIANKADADFFVSIHLNATKSGTARGVETYYLDTTSNRYALRLAARENRVSEDRVSDTELALADVATKAAVREAKKLAVKVQKNVFEAARNQDLAARDLGVKSSLFYVLLGARMPAVLVEAGFISNAAEEKLLVSAAYQKRLAKAITQAVQVSVEPPAPKTPGKSEAVASTGGGNKTVSRSATTTAGGHKAVSSSAATTASSHKAVSSSAATTAGGHKAVSSSAVATAGGNKTVGGGAVATKGVGGKTAAAHETLAVASPRQK